MEIVTKDVASDITQRTVADRIRTLEDIYKSGKLKSFNKFMEYFNCQVKISAYKASTSTEFNLLELENKFEFVKTKAHASTEFWSSWDSIIRLLGFKVSFSLPSSTENERVFVSWGDD